MQKTATTLNWNVSKNKPDNQYAYVKATVPGEQDTCVTVFKRKSDGKYGWVYNNTFSDDKFDDQNQAKIAFEQFISVDIGNEDEPPQNNADFPDDEIPF